MRKPESAYTCSDILAKFEGMKNQIAIKGMEKFGINVKTAYGIQVPFLRGMAKGIGRNHELALELWETGKHEPRLLAGMIADPKMCDERLMEWWVADFNSWDLCDQTCLNIFGKSASAWKKAFEWSGRKEEFVKRAGFALMAVLAVHDKNAKDVDFEKFLPIIKREATDERNYVRKAVNWALRQIGKRNGRLLEKALATAHEIEKIDSKTAKWIASDAIRELERKRE